MKQNLHIHTLLAALLPLLACLTGCMREEIVSGSAVEGQGLTIDYSFDDLQTRSVAATTSEKKFDDVYFVFYNSATQAYVAYQKTSAPSGNTGQGSFPLPIPEALTPGNTYNTLIVANYDRFKADGQTFEQYITANRSKDYGQMRRDMKSQAINRARVTTPLPLYGTLLGKDGEESLFTAPQPDATGKLPVSVRFSRAVSRFDLKNRVADKLVIAWVKVCNYRDAGYFFHQDAPLGDLVKGTAGSPPTDLNNLPDGYVKANPPLGTPANKQDLVEGGLYAYPNIVANSLQDDESTTCLLIAGYYQEPGSAPNTTKLTYYRANVADPGLSQVIKRNYVYTIVITGVQRAGSDTEDEAMAEKDRLLDYVVDDEWQDDGDNTVVDKNGNFLSVSRTAVVLDPPAGEAITIKVSVKEGLAWKTEFKQNNGNAFKVEKIDERSFMIVTNAKNESEFVNTAQLEVSATGGNVDPAAPLKITINITQLSTVNQLRMLSVEGQTGTLTYNVPGQGGTISLQVLTGGAYGAWVATPDNDLKNFIGQYSPQGANKGSIQIVFKPNVTKATRTGVLTVTRDPAEGVSPVIINFTQDPSPYVLTVFPNYGDRVLVVEGFSNETGNPNGVAKDIPFWVTLADPANYTFKVESSFRQDADAFLTLNAVPPKKTAYYSASTAGTALANGKDGQQFILSVFRTGPGDPDITGSITVTAVPNTSGLPTEVFSFSVRIVTSCGVGDCKVGTFTVADRNCGTALKSEAMTGLNYHYDTNFPDHINTPFQGMLYILQPPPNPDPCIQYGRDNYSGELATGWVQPSSTDWDAMLTNMKYSKGRAFVTDTENTSIQTGAWIPVVAEVKNYSGTYANGGCYLYKLGTTGQSKDNKWVYYNGGTFTYGAPPNYNWQWGMNGGWVRCIRK